ncbi:44481_t:CDS:2, partial [Gigaspora margarita]
MLKENAKSQLVNIITKNRSNKTHNNDSIDGYVIKENINNNKSIGSTSLDEINDMNTNKKKKVRTNLENIE